MITDTMTDMKFRLLVAATRVNTLSWQADLWPHVTDKGGWFVRILGPSVGGETVHKGTVFEITQSWGLTQGGTAPGYSTRWFCVYPAASLQITDCPAEFKHLL